MKRLFFAIPFPDDVQKDLHTLALLLQGHAGGRAVRPGNYHLTLRFLGECDAMREQAARRVLRGLPKIRPFDLVLGGTGSFKQRDSALVWMKADGGEALPGLHGEMERVLEQEGFPVERKPFFPHVTLLRDVPLGKAGEISLPAETRLSVNVTKAVLFESVNGSQGLVYKVVDAS